MNFLESFGSKLEPIAARIASNKILMAIKDGFIAIMPLMIVGSLAVLINNVFLSFGEDSLFYSFGVRLSEDTVKAIGEYKAIGGSMWQGSLGAMALLATFTIAYSYAKNANTDGVSAGTIAVASLLSVLVWNIEGKSEAVWAINPGQIGGTNIITGMIIALISAFVYSLFIKKNITIKMPETVPPGVMRSFAALIPAVVIVTSFSILAFIFAKNGTEISQIITDVIATPLKKFGADGPILAYIYVTLSNILYFFGIHGPNVLSFIENSVFVPASVENADNIAKGAEATLFFSKGMLDSFVFLGGGGATIGLIIALFIGSKNKGDKTIAKFAAPAGLFNINEPLVFGLPIVLNPILFIPFVILPPILLSTAWLQISMLHGLGLIKNMGAILIPWVSPPGIGALLAYQSVWAMLVAFVQIAISVFVYLPFVFAMNKSSLKEK